MRFCGFGTGNTCILASGTIPASNQIFNALLRRRYRSSMKNYMLNQSVRLLVRSILYKERRTFANDNAVRTLFAAMASSNFGYNIS